jgi:hypothetical protein
MKTALYGRILFGASAVVFGVIALMWHDPDTWQSLYSILRLPLGTIIGDVLMIALIAGGIALAFTPSVRQASIALGVLFVLFSLACIPGIIARPAIYGYYDGLFEQLSLLCGAIAVYAATDVNAAQAGAFGRAARIGFGVCTIAFMLAQIVYLKLTASLVPTWIPNQMFWAILTTVAFALAAIAILVNRQAKLALRLLTLMLALFGVLVWIPQLIAHPEMHGNWSEFALNFLITGAAWLVADLTA